MVKFSGPPCRVGQGESRLLRFERTWSATLLCYFTLLGDVEGAEGISEKWERTPSPSYCLLRAA